MKGVRLIRKALTLAVAITFLVPADAPAAGPSPTRTGARPASQVDVDMGDYFYQPRSVRVRPGETVRWTNVGIRNHTATSNTPVNLWDSGTIPPGQGPYSFVFIAAGTYLYHCTFHFAMTSAVSVVPTVMPPSGPVGTVFTVTVATEDTLGSVVYDIQRRDPGGQFQDWMIGVTTRSVLFDSTGQAPGTYSFRSRLRRVLDNVSSLYSLAESIQVTA
jgi:plastocyanin